MKMKITTTILSLLCLAVVGNLMAQHGGFGKGFDHSGPRDGAMRLQVLAVALDLTDDQMAQAQDLFSEFHTSNGGSMQQRQELHQQLRTSLDNGSTDGSGDLIQSYSKLLPLTYMIEPQRGKNNALGLSRRGVRRPPRRSLRP